MESFFPGWVARLEELVSDLLAAPRDNAHNAGVLVTSVLTHCHDYYREKSLLTTTNVFSVLTPTWLTPYERAFLWVAGWKPSLAFRLVRAALSAPLSIMQERAMGELEWEIAAGERGLSEEMARVQEAMAMVRARETVEVMAGSLEVLVGSADELRVQTVVRMVEILNPAQGVEFLVAAAQLYLRIRGWGERRRGTA